MVTMPSMPTVLPLLMVILSAQSPSLKVSTMDSYLCTRSARLTGLACSMLGTVVCDDHVGDKGSEGVARVVRWDGMGRRQ